MKIAQQNKITLVKKYLVNIQLPDGSFSAQSSTDINDFTQARNIDCTFFTALILSSLSDINSSTIAAIKSKAVRFLLSQKSQNWTFNYWKRNSQNSLLQPYPDDLDDTFCALGALFSYDPNLIGGRALANIITLLTVLEGTEGGPYRTWVVDSTASDVWKDIDLAVNTNIACFLHLNGISLPSLKKFIEDKIQNDKIISPYYPDVFPISYFISRAYNRNFGRNFSLKKDLILKLQNILLLKQSPTGDWGNPLNTALVVLTLLNFGYSVQNLEPAIEFLFKTIKKDHWNIYPFCIGASVKTGLEQYDGSEALTTALCLSAITAYFTKLQNLPIRKIDTDEINIHRKIIIYVKNRFEVFDPQFSKESKYILKYVFSKNQLRQITLLPFYFNKSITVHNQNITDDFIVKLGMANLYGWLAYTIYDNFLDEEGTPKQLSLANVSLRELVGIYLNLFPTHSEFNKYFQKILDDIDNANFKETFYCRLYDASDVTLNMKLSVGKDLEKLAQRSLGHALGPIAIIYKLDPQPKSADIEAILKFFSHYIIAKQLNDDAHDWETDFKKGHLTPVVCELLRKISNDNLEQFKLADYNIDKLRTVFWYEVIEDISKEISKNLNSARKSLKTLKLINEPIYLLQPIEVLEKLVQTTLQERQRAIDFLNTYHGI